MLLQKDKKVHPYAQEEESPNIRAALTLAIAEAQRAYNSTKEDHRYMQGYLHALEQFCGRITKPDSFVSRETSPQSGST